MNLSMMVDNNNGYGIQEEKTHFHIFFSLRVWMQWNTWKVFAPLHLEMSQYTRTRCTSEWINVEQWFSSKKARNSPPLQTLALTQKTDALPIDQKEINFVISIYIKILRFVFLLQDLKNCWLILIAVFN